MPPFDQLISDPSKLGMIGLMGVAIWGFLSGRILTAGHHAAVVARYEQQIIDLKQERADITLERNEFKEMALRSVETTDRALRVAEKK